MVRLKHALFSNSASGELGKAIQFVCGKYLREKPVIKDANSESQREYRTKFAQAADIWSNQLSKDTKDMWTQFQHFIYTSDRCIGSSFMKSGYNAWMSVFLELGVNGWKQYPYPPHDH